MRSDKVFHLISNTHWDREWRYPFQRNRQMLVEMIDNVLEILLKEPEYRAFHLDSQSIVLDDYLEIRPEKKQDIQKLVKAKRLLIGPWYILPDEFQVGGENLIRNLLLGHKVCSEFGGASKVGYSPFSWGQISQLPQIYAGFRIDVIMFYRGVNSIDSKSAEFLWEGADGTIALTSRFSTMPRYNFYFYIYRKVIHNEDFQDVEYSWKRKGLLFHTADAELKEDYYNIEPWDEYFPENVKSSVERIAADQADDFTTENVIWMEGHDSSGPNIKTVNIIRDIKKEFPGIKVLHSTLEEYAEALKKTVDYKKLPLLKEKEEVHNLTGEAGICMGIPYLQEWILSRRIS
jgi:mannosylglycerate hydrolase